MIEHKKVCKIQLKNDLLNKKNKIDFADMLEDEIQFNLGKVKEMFNNLDFINSKNQLLK